MAGWVSPTWDDDDYAEMTAVEPGIPDYMRPQVTGWITEECGGSYFDTEVPRMLTLVFKEKFPQSYRYFDNFLETMEDEKLVAVIDWLLYHKIRAIAARYQGLKAILDLGRSEWTITAIESGRPRMTRRIPEGVDIAYRDVVAKTEAAGGLLAEAFNAIYGAHPSPNESYGLSVKAVETIGCPRLLPNSGRATLGAIISHVEQKAVELPLLVKNVPHEQVLISMMRTLWEGGERHGSDTYQHVSIDGAKTALSLAFSLVSMLHDDVISLSPKVTETSA